VWRRGPTSGHVGAKAIIRGDGSLRGWISGACAEPTVLREATDAIRDGEPRLLFLGRPDELERLAHEGVITVPMACDSEGAMEVYLEPVLPRPQVVVVGRSPAVDILSTLAVDVGWAAVVLDDGGDPLDHPDPGRVRTSLDLSGLVIDGATAFVVATQGHYDDLALEVALATDAGYIGLVASAKRAAAVIELLGGRGVTGERLSRIVAPAGLDLGAVNNEEIAVAVLADLVARRAAGQLSVGLAMPVRATATDPVCGMAVHVEDSKYCSHRGDVENWFCSAGCQAAFEADPSRYQS